VLKVIISRGSGGRGYSAAVSIRHVFSAFQLILLTMRAGEEGITLTLSPVRLGRNPMLAGLKHLNRLEQVLIRTHLEQTDADEALVLDSEGFITECCAANLFWRRGRCVYAVAGSGWRKRHYAPVLLQQLAHSGFRVVEVNAGKRRCSRR
jgi:4-amino-4-deoxychorismate lyase